MEKVYVVTAVDFVGNTTSKARVLGAFRDEERAKIYVRNDMEDMVDNYAGLRANIDFDLMAVTFIDYTHGCLWNVEATEIR